jgi:hypothetical protein
MLKPGALDAKIDPFHRFKLADAVDSEMLESVAVDDRPAANVTPTMSAPVPPITATARAIANERLFITHLTS